MLEFRNLASLACSAFTVSPFVILLPLTSHMSAIMRIDFGTQASANSWPVTSEERQRFRRSTQSLSEER